MRSPCPNALPTPVLAENRPCQASCPCPTTSSPPCIPRNLWQEVTRYLRLGNIDAATEQKRRLEEKQRVEERKRENLHTPWQPKYFIQEVTLPPAFGDLSQARGAWVCLANAAIWMDEGGGGEVLGRFGVALLSPSFGPGRPRGTTERLTLPL